MEDPLSGQGMENMIAEFKMEPEFIDPMKCEVFQDDPLAIVSGIVEDRLHFFYGDGSANADGHEEETFKDNSESMTEPLKSKFRCEICNKQFSRKSNLKRHMAEFHSDEKPYACSICHRQFSGMSVLKAHMKSHSEAKPHQCNICQKQFRTKAGFTLHMKRHSGVKPYQCSICGKQFLQKHNFGLHMKRHSGEKAHGCSVCDKQFVTKYELIVHMPLHTGQKPHQCNICEKQFLQKRFLTNHLKRHEKHYQCAICDLKCSCKQSLENFAKTKVETNHESEAYEPRQDAGPAKMEDRLLSESTIKIKTDEVFADPWESEEVGIPRKVTPGIHRPLDGLSADEPNIQSILNNVLSFQLPF